jgi:hypothetical protein
MTHAELDSADVPKPLTFSNRTAPRSICVAALFQDGASVAPPFFAAAPQVCPAQVSSGEARALAVDRQPPAGQIA